MSGGWKTFDMEPTVVKGISNMKNLSFLSINYDCTDNILLCLCEHCPNLKSIDLSSSKLINDDSIDILINLKKLRYVQLYRTSVTLEGYVNVLLNLEHIEDLGRCDELVVHIDLKSDLLTPGKKYYDRVKWCLSNNLQPMSVIWLGFQMKNQFVHHPLTNYSVQVPILDISSNVKYCTNAELLEWIGIHSIGASLDMENYDYLSSYQIPEQNTTFGQVLYLKATGFYSASQVLEIFDAIRSYSSSRPHLPWISLHVQGFHDSPVSWGLKEHQFYTSGDNSYTIVIKPDDQFILQTIISSNKRPK
ncbi:ribonuclease P protein subunit p40-like [Ctenocephalides felis]|uniref:ribonuclease P protein subunit p40-like n=1 Tax=Ctenocephalides felis TaxID=7515 RepID=UPI000E6E1784|nr:ribonuclease P protein subunit p40-like [Ctenocephalides felis]